VRILINGKATGAGAGNIADVLRTIPADQIKNIEVMANPSAKYDAEGSAGVINIITKQKSTGGFSGSVSGGAGTRQNNFNGNINYNTGKFSLSANLGLNNGWPQTSHSYLRQSFDGETVNTLQETRGESQSKRNGVNPSLSLGYEISERDNISTGFRYNNGGFENHGSSQSSFTDNINPVNNTAYSAGTYSKFGWKGFDWNADYRHKFEKQGHEFTFSSQWSQNHMITKYSNDYTDFYQDQRADNDGQNNEYTFQADYALPITDSLKLEAGGKTILRRFKSDFSNFVPDGGSMVYDPENSNLYNYNQDVFAGYAVGTLNLKKGYTIMAGARIEHTGIKGNAENEIQQDLAPFTINYETFIPSLTLQKNISMGKSLKLTYSKRITRPSMNLLNPFINRTNIQAQTQGNPDLDPEVSQTVEFSYGSFSQKATLNAALYYRNTSGLIESVAVPLDGESGTIATSQNIGRNNSVGLSLFGSVTLFKILSLRGNFNAYTYNPSTSSAYSGVQTQNGTYFQYNAFVSGTLTFESGLSGELFVIQNSSRRTIQGTNPAFNMLSLGVKKQFWDKKASLGINITSPFKKDLTFNSRTTSQNFSTVNNFSVPFQSFGLTFSYNFGKMQYGNNNRSKINNDDMRQDSQGGQGQAPSN
jgi:outer membrane receptor protein involved in Fe transport